MARVISIRQEGSSRALVGDHMGWSSTGGGRGGLWLAWRRGVPRVFGEHSKWGEDVEWSEASLGKRLVLYQTLSFQTVGEHGEYLLRL